MDRHRAVSDSQWRLRRTSFASAEYNGSRPAPSVLTLPSVGANRPKSTLCGSGVMRASNTQLSLTTVMLRRRICSHTRCDRAQKHMRNGFGSAVILTPNVPNGGGGSGSPENQNSEQLCTHEYKDASGSTGHGQRPCWFDSSDRLYEPPGFLHHQEVRATTTSIWFAIIARHPQLSSCRSCVHCAAACRKRKSLVNDTASLSATSHHDADLHASDFLSLPSMVLLYRFSGKLAGGRADTCRRIAM